MARFFDPNEDDLFVRAAAQRQAIATYAEHVTPGVAQDVASLGAAYPHLPAGAALSMGQAGVQPGTPVAEAASNAAVTQKHHGIGSMVGHWLSGAASAAWGFTDNVLLRSLHPGDAPDWLKGASRGLTGALQLPYEVAQGQFRTLYSDATSGDFGGLYKDALKTTVSPFLANASQTSAGVAAQQLATTGSVDAGSGFFVNGTVAQQQAVNARAAGMVDGHAVTPGRALAHTLADLHVVEPGHRPYNIVSGLTDAALAWVADPGSTIATSASRAAKARKVLTGMDVGLVDGTRRTVLTPKVDGWLTSPQGRRVTDYLTHETDFERMRQNTNGKIPVSTLVELTDARNPDEVQGIIRKAVGLGDIREKPGITQAALADVGMEKRFGLADANVRRVVQQSRLLQDMPGREINLLEPDEAVHTIDLFQRNARMNPAVRAANNEKMARAANPIERFNVLTDVLGQTNGALQSMNVEPRVARRMTQMVKDYHDHLRAYFVDEIGNNVAVPGAVVDGKGVALASPHLLVEHVNSTMPLPDAREIRRLTSRFSNVLTNPAVELGTATADFLTGQVFKPLVLLRGAWTARVIGEEQIRMGATGLDSLFRHPLSHLSYAVGRDSRVGKVLEKVPGVTPGRAATGLTGDAFSTDRTVGEVNQFAEAMSRSRSEWTDRSMITVKGMTRYRKAEEQYHRAWAGELQQLAADPVASRVAGGLREGDRVALPEGVGRSTPDAVKEWFWAGAGKAQRNLLAQANDKTGLLTREGSDAYINSIEHRLRVKTGGHPQLIDAVSTGRLRGERLSDGLELNPKVIRTLRDDAELESAGPDVVKGAITTAGRGSPGAKVAQAADRAVEFMFNTLMSRPTNYLSRSPAFKQFYWQRAEELLPHMSPEAQRAALANAEKARLGKDMLRRMRAMTATRGNLAVHEADVVAKGHALDQTRGLLYDLSKHNQFFDANRAIMPFGEAWKEILTTWARIGVENPSVARRGQQLITGARNADPNDDGKGFFYSDPQTGKEMFGFPGTALLNRVVTGVPVPLEGQVSGLNLLSTSVLPGFGPVVQIPASHLIPDRPEWDAVRKIFLPYGESDTSAGFLESLEPAWLQKWKASGYFSGVPLMGRSRSQERQYANTVASVMDYLATTGDYQMGTFEGQQKMLQDARSKASRLMLIRGAAQYVTPTAPTPEFLAKDKDGKATTTWLLAQEYRKLQQADYRTATEKFIDRFGEGAFLSTIGNTEGPVQPTRSAMNFSREHPELAREFPQVYGYFAPADGKFDSTAYQRQLDTGERSQVSPEDQLARANQRLGAMVYAQAKAKVGDSPSQEQRDWLRTVQDALRKEYHGYEPDTFDPTQIPKLIQQVQDAAANPTIRSTDVGQGLVVYLQARQKALEAARARGLSSFRSADRAAPIRSWLRTVGEAIVAEHPQFGDLFDRVLEREMADDSKVAA